MEGRRASRQRALTRCYHGNRLEDQLWATAYEQVWPVIRRALTRRNADDARSAADRADMATGVARRA
jgi:hypothetical protein